MSDPNNLFPFAELEDDGLDIAAIFGSEKTAPPPPAPEQTQTPDSTANAETPVIQPAETIPEQTVVAKAEATPETELDLFSALVPQTQTAVPAPRQDTPKAVSLFDKPPVFSYGGTTEDIKDSSMTFEELRIEKADDFPELAEGKRVSWSVEYGKVTKSITDPKGTTIAKIKEEIEKSKPFLDALKKAKDKDRNPSCLIKPRVTAQSKGIASYKGIFPDLAAARASDKTICLIPAQDGKIYELRKTEMGAFVAPKNNIVEFSEVRAGFYPALPLIPGEIMSQIISFFRSFMNEGEEFEALAHIYWDKELQEYTVFIPKQKVSKITIDADLRGDALPEERYIHYADVHSHNSMEARFSVRDNRDEKATRLYFVIGHLERFFPEITARFSCGGVHQEIDPHMVLEGLGREFPWEWLNQVERTSSKEESGASFFDLLDKFAEETAE